jgi:hypothetical protein
MQMRITQEGSSKQQPGRRPKAEDAAEADGESTTD